MPLGLGVIVGVIEGVGGRFTDPIIILSLLSITFKK
jgi:hypothetical protein